MKHYFVIFLLLITSQVYALDIKHLSLEKCEQDALQTSAHLSQLKSRASSAHEQEKASKSSLYPSLTLDAKGSWVSDVPEMAIGTTQIKFGDNFGYSVGPTATYVLFDNGGSSSVRKSASSAAQAAKQEYNFARKQILLQVRQAYFAIQQQLEHLVLLNGQLELAAKQLEDINSAYKAGAKSKLDISIAKKQVLKTKTAMSAARGALATQLRNLFKLTGSDYGIDPSYPTDKRLANLKLDGNTSAILASDNLEKTLLSFTPYKQSEFDENSPKLAALDDMAKYYEYLADSYKSSLYPRIVLQGGAYFEYPNGAIREHVFLGRAGAALSMPLFEGGKNRNQSKAQEELANASKYQKQDAKETLEKLFYSAKDRLYALQVQEDLVKQTIEEAKQTSNLTYQAYQAGAVTFFEVDRANLTLLESQLALADLQTEQLNQLALLNSLSKESL